MGAADGAYPHRDASLMDADANMNCTKRRSEEARSSTVTATGVTPKESAETGKTDKYVARWRWPDLTVQLFIHLGCLYGFYLIFTSAKLLTTIWGESPFMMTSFVIFALQQTLFRAT
jgi:stearoyl-CoA desaturase (delta-9 desaturase)